MKIGEWKQQEYKEIDSLEAYLLQYQNEWNDTKEIRSNKWRKHFFVCFVITILIAIFAPQFFWIGLIVVAYFAGSLFSLLRQNAKTIRKISEHKKQLQLVRLLRNFETSPFTQNSDGNTQ